MSRSRTRKVLSTFVPALRPHAAALITSTLFSLLAVGATVVAPWPLKFIIDNVLSAHPLPGWLDGWISYLSPSLMVLAFGASAVAIAAVGAFGTAVEKNINAAVREKMTLELRERVLRHIQSLSVTHRVNDRSGELALHLVDDVHHIVRLLTKTAPVIIRHVVTSLVIFVVMFGLELRLGLAGLVIVVVLVWLTRHYAKPLGAVSRAKRRHEGRVAGFTQEVLRGLPAIQALGTEDTVRERFVAMNRESLAAGVRETRAAVSMERIMQLANGFAVATIVAGGGLLVLAGDLTVGGLTIYAAYIVQLLKPVEKINELASTVARAMARGERLLLLLERPPAFVDPPEAIDIKQAKGTIELRDVSYAYPESDDDRQCTSVLNRINLTLRPGSLTVLTGPSGAGKSTLLHLLLRIIEPTAGEIVLDGLAYPKIRLTSLRSQFAVMLQETHLFAGTIRDSLQTTETPLKDKVLWRALSQVGLDGFVGEMPGHLEAHLGEAAVNLSGGQRARLSLARALILDRPVLLLDEPLANVDVESQRIILDAVRRLKSRRSCLAISHQCAMTEIADRVLRLDGSGTLTEVSSSLAGTAPTLGIVK